MSVRAPHPAVSGSLTVVLLGGALTGLGPAGPAVAGGPAPVACHGVPATIVGTAGRDRLVGTAGPDVIVGLGGRDVIRGGGGADVVCGGDGADSLWGGPGDDRLHGGRDSRGADRAGVFLVGDVLRGGPGDDLLDLGVDDRRGHKPPDAVAYDESRHPVVVDLSGDGDGTATGEGTDRIVRSTETGVVGSAYADTITGSAGDDELLGGGGDDTLAGGPGDDTLTGDEAFADPGRIGSQPQPQVTASDDDLVHGDGGTDILGSGRGHDQLFGDDDHDFVQVTGADATDVHGGAGFDVVEQLLATETGGTSDGGPGYDYLTVLGSPFEGASPRTAYTLDLRTGTSSVGPEPAVTGAVGGYEEYRLQGRLRWRFLGTPGDDRVWALSGGPLRARTYAGDDWMIGTSRADRLDGGAGTDEADGREAADTCRHIEVTTSC